MIRLNGTCCSPSDFAFCCLGLGSDLDWLSLFLSADFCAREAEETIQTVKAGFQLHAEIQTLNKVVPFAALGLGVAAGLGLCLGVAALVSGETAGLIFLGGGPGADCRSLLNSNFLFAGGCEDIINVEN